MDPAVSEPNELVVCYNGSCPVCRAEIERYRGRAADPSGLTFLDVAADPVAAARLGLIGDRPLRRLHAVDGNGKIVGGIAAFAKVWEQLPGYRWLAAAADRAIPRAIAEFTYERLAAPLLFRLHLRRQRRGRSGRG